MIALSANVFRSTQSPSERVSRNARTDDGAIAQIVAKHVMLRDGERCRFCAQEALVLPTMAVPSCEGGRLTNENVVMACVPCRAKKGQRTPEDAKMILWPPLK